MVGEDGFGFLRSGGSSSKVHCLFICLDGGYTSSPSRSFDSLAFHTWRARLWNRTAAFSSALGRTEWKSDSIVAIDKSKTYTSVARSVLSRPKGPRQLNLDECANPTDCILRHTHLGRSGECGTRVSRGRLRVSGVCGHLSGGGRNEERQKSVSK